MNTLNLNKKNHHYGKMQLPLLLVIIPIFMGLIAASPLWADDICSEIRTCADLQNIQNNLGGCYSIATDINCSETKTWNSGAGFVPIGTPSSPFTGKLLGNNKKIIGVHIAKRDWAGLFNFTQGAEIRDLILQDFDVSGESAIGTLVAVAQAGSVVENVHATGKITNMMGAMDADYLLWALGGLIGDNSGVVRQCSSNVEINSNAVFPIWTGGLVGHNWGSIIKSYSKGSIIAVDSPDFVVLSGGLVGCNPGTIENSYSGVNISGGYGAGGLVGIQSQDCTFAMPVNTSLITNSFAYGMIETSTSDTGGLVAYLGGESNINNSYWDAERTQKTNSPGSADTSGKTTSGMQQQGTFAGWDFANTWSICPNQSYPSLKQENLYCLPESRNAPADLLADNRYGLSVAVTDNTLAALNLNRNFPAPYTNFSDVSVRVFSKSLAGWDFQTKLNFDPQIPPSTSGVYQNAKVLLDGDNMVVTVPYFTNSAAYMNIHIMHRTGTTWTEEKLLHYVNANPNGDINPLQVSLSGETLAVGREKEKVIEVYRRLSGGWILESTLTADTLDETFGSAISLSQDMLAAGAPSVNAVYIFKREGTTWAKNAKLQEASAQFGVVVALDNNNLAIQSADTDYSFTFYELNGQSWIRKQNLKFKQLVAAGIYRQFNPWRIVALKGNNLVISTFVKNGSFTMPGASVIIYKLINNSWQEQNYIVKGAAGPFGAHFGDAVSASNQTIAVGAPLESSGWIGAVYLYSLPDTTPPVNASISINGGSFATRFYSTTLTLSAEDIASGVAQMQFSNDNINWSAPEVYKTTRNNWNLTYGAYALPDGTKTVYTKFKDAANNWMTTPATDTIIFDTKVPTVAGAVTKTYSDASKIKFSIPATDLVAGVDAISGINTFGITTRKATIGSSTLTGYYMGYSNSYTCTNTSSEAGGVTTYVVDCPVPAADQASIVFVPRLVDKAGNGPASDKYWYTNGKVLPPDKTPPSVVTGLTEVSHNANEISLKWNASVDDVTETRDKVSYAIHRNGSTTPIKTVTTLNYTDTGLTEGTTNTYQVYSQDVWPNKQTQSPTLTVTTSTLPVNITLTGSLYNGYSAKLSWTALAGVSNYKVYRDGVLILTTTALNYTNTGLSGGRTYTYKVTGVNASNVEIGKSNVISVTTSGGASPSPAP